MKTNVKMLGLVLFVAASALACTPKENMATDAGATMGSTSAMASMTAAPSAAPVTAASDPLPSHADAVKTARTEITKANYKAELDKIEKESE